MTKEKGNSDDMDKPVSRRFFLGRTGKLIALGAATHFALIGGVKTASAGGGDGGEGDACQDPAQPIRVRCDQVTPDEVEEPDPCTQILVHVLCVVIFTDKVE